MTSAILMLSTLLKRAVLPAIAFMTLSLCAGQLLAQAGTPAGAAGGQTDPGANKPHPRHTPQEIEDAFKKAKGGKVKKSPKIKNTHNTEDAQIAALLAALEELKAGRSHAGNKPKGSSGENNNAGGSTPSGGNPPGTNPTGAGGGKSSGGGSSTGGSNPPGTPAAGTPGAGTPGAGAGAGRPSIAVANVATLRAPAAIAPASTPPSSGSGSSSPASNRGIVMQPGLNSAVGCSLKSAMIQSINNIGTGVSNPKIVFTQDPQYNDYKITGCNFGQSQGQAHLNGPFRAGQVAMQIALWTDTEIELKVSPSLTGETDQNNVSLVIVPVGGAQVQLQNCKFYAMRQEVTLTHVSQGLVTLASVTDTGGFVVPSVKFSSPYKGQVSQGSQSTMTAFTGGVDRYDTYRFGAGIDVWDFSNLAPGFVPTNFSLSHWALDTCNAESLIVSDPTVYDDGQWSAQWDAGNPKHLIVNFAEQHCHETDGSDASNSSYALEVQVSGPVGVNPMP